MRALPGSGVPVYGRLRPGVQIDTAARELTARLAPAEARPELRVSLTTIYEDALALLLTLVGIFGTTAYAVARRTREVGIRMALGARSHQVVRAIMLDAAGPVALGLAAGFAGAMAVTGVLGSFLFETTPSDPLTFLTTVVLLAGTAVTAAWIPARRAAHVDPVKALRAD